MFDVFYMGAKPNLFPHERSVESVDQARALSRTRFCWVVTYLADYTGWDWLWEPVPWQAQYTHAWPSQWQPDSGTYLIPKSGGSIHYHTHPQIPRRGSRDGWLLHEPIDEQSWDWSWHPNPQDPPYIYVWGNQWCDSLDHVSISYTVPGATEIKYMEARTQRLPDDSAFRCLLPVQQFDFSWMPNPRDPAMTYVWGNQWNPAELEPTVVYRNGSDTVKYMHDQQALLAPDTTLWTVLDDIEQFDFSWRPNPTDPAYVYVFGNQWLTPEQRPAVRYTVPGATEIKYMSEPRARRRGDPARFRTHYACEFDYTWEPDPGSPPYIYVFGNQWHSSEIMPTVELALPGATERKYMDQPRAQLTEQRDDRWHTIVDCEWDYSWCPDPGDPAYIYVFGNQWHSSEIMPTVEYHVPGATERKFMSEPRARLRADPERWSVPDSIDAENIDFSWVPDPGSPAYIYHFGSEYQQSVGLTYHMPGATEIKFAGDIPRLDVERSAVVLPDIFYMDRSGPHSRHRFERLLPRYPNIQRIRWVNSTMDTIVRCCARTQQNRFWVISSDNVYDNFDFAWHPETWQTGMTHVFGSQWNKWSDTFLINRWEFERHSRWAQDIEHFPNLNFVSDQSITVPQDQLAIYVIDHQNYSDLPDHISISIRHVTRFYNSYLETLRRILADVQDDYVWVISTICDYKDFDFGWRPEPWQRDMLHVFPSGSQKFGDTFYVPVAALRARINDLERLEWFDTVNFCSDQRVERRPFPVIQHSRDSHVEEVKRNQFVGPAAIFTNCADQEPPQIFRDLINFWATDTRAIVSLDPGNQRIIVPREAPVHVRTQLYDYPYIDTRQHALKNQPLDVVFISNGEQQADNNYQHLRWAVERADSNRITHVAGVNGRVAAYHAAAQASTTPWFFAVFAKLEVFHGFDWQWQPDRMQAAKHYIFHARNPVNGLVYGHQAMIAYNRDMVLANTGQGLDFTLDQPHEVVPILSGTAYYAVTPWQAWRTAFREVIKLRHSLPDVENEFRLHRWLKCPNDGTNSDWSAWGAQDAMEYYDQVGGDFDQLRKSYEWAWLASYAFMRRGLTPGQQ
jgi:hypothetical protein